MRRVRAALRVALYAALAAGTLLALSLAAEAGPEREPAPAVASVVTPGPFALRRADGTTLDSVDLDGVPYGLMFGFTHCPDICPTALGELTAALARASGLPAGYRIYFVAVDDARDTPEAVRAYLAAFDGRIVGLTGGREEIAEAAQAFGAVARRRDHPDGGYAMEHTSGLFLVDQNGVIADRVAFTDAPERIAQRITAAAGR
ncbi:MAG: SCO family protein [Ancylobacter novellus]|uniref:SCO family protein n=1 Tax=Ancylobacter novellus TaxID=921 RepID=A0A2W5KUJ2_ANCNO|nr:MAG: SCO family protein [Ancylobacter novellus]